jgi:hypothetical protein
LYGIILDDNEVEGLNLNYDSADYAAEHLDLDQYMTNFSIEEYNDGNGSYNTILILVGNFKPEVIDDYGIKNAKKEVLDLEGVLNIIKL